MATISQVKIGSTYYDLQDSIAKNWWNQSNSYRLTKAVSGVSTTVSATNSKWYRLLRFYYGTYISEDNFLMIVFGFVKIDGNSSAKSPFGMRIGYGSGSNTNNVDLGNMLRLNNATYCSGMGQLWDSAQSGYRSMSCVYDSAIGPVESIDMAGYQATGSARNMQGKGSLLYFSKVGTSTTTPNIIVETTPVAF